MIPGKLTFLATLLVLAFSTVMVQRAWSLDLPSSLAQQVVSEGVPTAFAPTSWSSKDFLLQWGGSPPDGAQAEILPGSLQWVRVADYLVLPRAMATVTLRNATSGHVQVSGINTPMLRDGSELKVTFAVALLSASSDGSHRVEVDYERNGSPQKAFLQIIFHPQKPSADDQRVLRDPSCSKFNLKSQSAHLRSGDWLYLGCRMIAVRTPSGEAMQLDLLVYWNGANSDIQIEGSPTAANQESLWAIRVPSQPGATRLNSQGSTVSLSYKFPNELHRYHLGLGLGPYSYLYQGLDGRLSQPSPVLTIYGSMFLTDTSRLLVFDATAFNSRMNTDFGIYFSPEQAKILDRRLSIEILLGVHFIGFNALGSYQVLFGLPQGIEFIFSDAFARGSNLSLGAFIYPKINNTAYDNVWIRWGGSHFVEFNYITWSQDFADNQHAFSRNIGVSYGFPLASF